jgi:hypothetical protein
MGGTALGRRRLTRPHGQSGHRGHLVASLADPRFRRLLAVRLVGQFGDGVFTAGLAGAVLFNPERQAHPAQIAAGFAVLLLPYSVIGPFAGVLLDRFRRQRVLTRINVTRAAFVLVVAAEIAVGLDGIGFYASALVVISTSRFLLSALGAGLPHVVEPGELVTANALSTTAGAVVAATGGAAALGAKALLGDSSGDYAVVGAAAALFYLVAAAIAVGIKADTLGPSLDERDARPTFVAVLRGLRDAARAINAVPRVRDGLAVVGMHRICYGVTLVCTLLLYRNFLVASGFFRVGLAGLSQVIAAVAIGGGAAALVTPVAFRTIGPVRWPSLLLLGAAVVELGLVLPFRTPLLLGAALLLGFVAQAVKITVDTLVQQGIDDAHLGRVFAFYDMLFNLALVLAAVFTAVVLPADGHSAASVIVIAVLYALAALAYAATGRTADRNELTRSSSAPSTKPSVR